MEDLRYLDWQTNLSKSRGSGGCYYKSEYDGKFYKLSLFDNFSGKVEGVESINEVVVSRFCDLVGLSHIEYRGVEGIINICGKDLSAYICVSDDFSQDGYSKILYETMLMANNMPLNDPVGNFKKLGFLKEYCEYCLLDFIIRNVDRHEANIEFLVPDGRMVINGIKLVDPFDNGLSLYSFYYNDIFKMLSAPIIDDAKTNTCLTVDRKLSTGLLNIHKLGIKLVLNPIPREVSVLRKVLFDDAMYDYLLTGSSDGNLLYAEKVCEILIGRYEYAKEKGIFVER